MDARELFEKLRPVLGKQLDALWFEYLADRNARAEIEEILQLLAMRHLQISASGSPMLLPPPSSAKSRGSYQLGTVMYAGKEVGPFGLREREWIQHIAIFGRAGSGKTNVGFLIFEELLRHGKPVWVFDWKRNYRDLARRLGVRVLTVGRDVAPFSFNPLQAPPGSDAETWLKKLVEILSHGYGFRQAAAYVLEKALYALHDQHNSPTLPDLRDHLQTIKVSGRESQWIQSARRVAGTLCFGPVSKVLGGTSADIPNLLTQPVVFELDALTDRDKTFLIDALLLWIHQYRMQQPGREEFRHATIIEEAHHVLLKHAQSRDSVMDIVLREIRELGESVILIDQHPSLISVPSLGNTYCTIAMNVKHGADVAALGSALQLNAESREYLGRLPVGAAIVRLQGRWGRPFLVRFPLLNVAKGSVGDEQLRSNSNDSVPRTDIRPQEAMRGEIRAVRDADEGASGQRNRDGRTERCLLLMADAAAVVACGVAERYRRLGLSVAAGTEAKQEILRRGWAREGRVRFNGRNITGILLTTAGVAALRESGWQGSCATPDDRAGTDHEFWKAWLFVELQKTGMQVQAECALPNGHRVDLLLPSLNMAIEVETGKSNVQSNVNRLREAGIETILIVATAQDVSDADGIPAISTSELVTRGVARLFGDRAVA